MFVTDGGTARAATGATVASPLDGVSSPAGRDPSLALAISRPVSADRPLSANHPASNPAQPRARVHAGPVRGANRTSAYGAPACAWHNVGPLEAPRRQGEQ